MFFLFNFNYIQIFLVHSTKKIMVIMAPYNTKLKQNLQQHNQINQVLEINKNSLLENQ